MRWLRVSDAGGDGGEDGRQCLGHLLLTGGTPGKRAALPNAKMLIHQVWTPGGGRRQDGTGWHWGWW
mgnify:CR=1 FL=1